MLPVEWHDGRDVVRIIRGRHRRQLEPRRGGRQVDARLRGLAARQQRGNGVGGVMLRRRRDGRRIGVVERPAVNEFRERRRRDHERLQLARRAKLASDQLGLVDQHRRVVLVEHLLRGDRGAAGGGVGVDLPNHDVARGETCAQGAERGGGLERAGTAAAREHQHDRLRGRLVIKLVGDAALIVQPEIWHERSGRQSAGRLRRGKRAQIERAVGMIHRGQCSARDEQENARCPPGAGGVARVRGGRGDRNKVHGGNSTGGQPGVDWPPLATEKYKERH